jgi:hypothetical protein
MTNLDERKVLECFACGERLESWDGKTGGVYGAKCENCGGTAFRAVMAFPWRSSEPELKEESKPEPFEGSDG